MLRLAALCVAVVTGGCAELPAALGIDSRTSCSDAKIALSEYNLSQISSQEVQGRAGPLTETVYSAKIGGTDHTIRVACMGETLMQVVTQARARGDQSVHNTLDALFSEVSVSNVSVTLGSHGGKGTPLLCSVGRLSVNLISQSDPEFAEGVLIGLHITPRADAC